MRRTERLFHLVERLRAAQRPITASQLSQELNVSERTVYRDIKLLSEQGLPISGEAGIGYLLSDEFDAPSLQFSADELEILAIGLRLVYREGDAPMRRTADLVLSKIRSGMKGRVDFDRIDLYAAGEQNHPAPFLSTIRTAIREKLIIRVQYKSLDGTLSEREVKPLALQFFHNATLLAGYCTLREDFRHFRVDRIGKLEKSGSSFRSEHYRLRQAFLRYVATDRSNSPQSIQPNV